ncbi:MAG: hypothetical protein AAFW46_01455 [Pseudomonadota bacterium]
MVRIGAFTVPLDGAALFERILINRAYGDVDNPYDAGEVWRGAGGFAAGLGRGAMASGVYRGRAIALQGGAVADAVEDESFPGLRGLIEAFPYTRYEQLDAETADAAARALPFEHFVLSTRDAGQQMQTVENNLRRSYDQAFGALAARPPRFVYFDDPLAPDSVKLRVQFGFGVFAPEDDARPEGDLELAAASPRDETPGEWRSLRLGDPEEGRPAALYRGQSGVAFSSALRHAPAVAAPGVLPEDHVFYYGRYSEEDAPGFRILPVGARAADKTPRYAAENFGSDPETGQTAVGVRGPSGRAEFYCRTRPTARDGALSPAPPRERAHLRLEGLILPETGVFHGLREWWIDFTRAGRLSAAPLDERAWAVASGPPGRFGGGSGGVVRLYNRAQHEEAGLFDEGDELRVGPEQTLFRRVLRYPADAPDAARRLWRARLHALVPLGYARLRPADRQFVTHRRSDEETALSLDWLDACGGVALPARTLSGAPETAGLAAWSLGAAGVRMRRLPDAEIEIAADRALAVARLEEDGLLTPAALGEPIRFRLGETLVIGCHQFRYVGAADAL